VADGLPSFISGTSNWLRKPRFARHFAPPGLRIRFGVRNLYDPTFAQGLQVESIIAGSREGSLQSLISGFVSRREGCQMNGLAVITHHRGREAAD